MGQMRASLDFAKKHFGRKIINAVETGVCAGQNAELIRNNLRINKLYLIDLWDPNYNEHIYDWLLEVFKRFENDPKTVIIREEASQASQLFHDGTIDYLYLDDCHNPDHVAKEIDLWLPKVSKGGIISGHDYVNDLGRVDAAVKAKFEYFDYKPNKGERVGDWWVVKE